MAPGRPQAHEAFGHFVEVYESKCPYAEACLANDRDALLTSYGFPAENWNTSAPPTRSNQPSLPSDYAPPKPRAGAADSPQ